MAVGNRSSTRRWAMLAVAAVTLLALYTTLQRIKLPLIHHVVVETLIQKAPAGIDEGAIRQNFEATLEFARRHDLEQEYLEFLLELSLRLEKVQQLSHSEAVRILSRVQAFPLLYGPPARHPSGQVGSPRERDPLRPVLHPGDSLSTLVC